MIRLGIDDGEVPKHEIRDRHLMSQRPSRIGEFVMREAVDGPFHVNRKAVALVTSRTVRFGGGRQGLFVCGCWTVGEEERGGQGHTCHHMLLELLKVVPFVAVGVLGFGLAVP
jgi:hypothetical protein